MKERGSSPRWARRHTRCKRCRTTKSPHNGRGLCQRCYNQWRRLNPDAERINKPLLRRVRNGIEQFYCRHCEEWKTRDGYADNKRMPWGVALPCLACHAAYMHDRYWDDVEGSRKRHRERAQKMRQREIEADKAFPEALRKAQHRTGVVPADMVTRWIDEAVDPARSDVMDGETIAQLAGVSARTLYRIRHASKDVKIETAERIAFVTGHTEELRGLFAPPGVEGWGPHGARHCGRCGSWLHPHKARGFCKRCYQIVYWHQKRGQRVPPPPSERWSYYHDYCVKCRRADKKHQARGLCMRCYFALKHDYSQDGRGVRDFSDYLTLLGYPSKRPGVVEQRRRETSARRAHV